MWKAKKNIWREIQIPSPSRLMDEQAPRSVLCLVPPGGDQSPWKVLEGS